MGPLTDCFTAVLVLHSSPSLSGLRAAEASGISRHPSAHITATLTMHYLHDHSKKTPEPWAAKMGLWFLEPRGWGLKQEDAFLPLPRFLWEALPLGSKARLLLNPKSFKVAAEKSPFICTLGLTRVPGTMNWAQIQVTAPLKTEGFFPEPNCCLTPSSQEAPQSLMKMAYPTSATLPGTCWYGWGPTVGWIPSTRVCTHTYSYPPAHPGSSAWAPFHGQGPTLLNLIIWGQKAAGGHVSPHISQHCPEISRDTYI